MQPQINPINNPLNNNLMQNSTLKLFSQNLRNLCKGLKTLYPNNQFCFSSDRNYQMHDGALLLTIWHGSDGILQIEPITWDAIQESGLDTRELQTPNLKYLIAEDL